MLSLFIKNKSLLGAFASVYIFTIVKWILNYGLYSLNTLLGFGDAFDIIDVDENGY